MKNKTHDVQMTAEAQRYIDSGVDPTIVYINSALFSLGMGATSDDVEAFARRLGNHLTLKFKDLGPVLVVPIAGLSPGTFDPDLLGYIQDIFADGTWEQLLSDEAAEALDNR